MGIKSDKILGSFKDFKFSFKKLSITYNLEKESENNSLTNEFLLDSIYHQLELFDAHHISRNGNKIDFINTFFERGFKPTLMGVLSRGSITIEDSEKKSTICYQCEYTILYDLGFLFFGIILSILFNPMFEVWIIGGILGFIIRYFVVYSKSNELIDRVGAYWI